MAEYKQIKIRIWQDNWFLSLNPEEKLLWLFLLTNQYNHISGLYELPKTLISPLTGIKNWEEILLKFAKNGKIKLLDGWIYVLNQKRHQPMSESARDKVNIGINNYLEENKEILAKFKGIKEAPCKTLEDPSITLLKVKDKGKGKVKDKVKTNTNVLEQVKEYGNTKINSLLKEFEEIMKFKSASSKDRIFANHLIKNFTPEQLTAMLTFCSTNEYAPRIGSLEKMWFKRGDIIAGIKAEVNKSKNKITIV